jgi:hypothetical protein
MPSTAVDEVRHRPRRQDGASRRETVPRRHRMPRDRLRRLSLSADRCYPTAWAANPCSWLTADVAGDSRRPRRSVLRPLRPGSDRRSSGRPPQLRTRLLHRSDVNPGNAALAFRDACWSALMQGYWGLRVAKHPCEPASGGGGGNVEAAAIVGWTLSILRVAHSGRQIRRQARPGDPPGSRRSQGSIVPGRA